MAPVILLHATHISPATNLAIGPFSLFTLTYLTLSCTRLQFQEILDDNLSPSLQNFQHEKHPKRMDSPMDLKNLIFLLFLKPFNVTAAHGLTVFQTPNIQTLQIKITLTSTKISTGTQIFHSDSSKPCSSTSTSCCRWNITEDDQMMYFLCNMTVFVSAHREASH